MKLALLADLLLGTDLTGQKSEETCQRQECAFRRDARYITGEA